jgi:hypothetical protein
MQSSARLFNCARCQSQVVICSQCDRGNRYCGRACARVARRQSMRAAGERYQKGRRGRFAHADRQRRYRQRRKQKVTHQGSPAVVPDETLPTESRASTRRIESCATDADDGIRCHFCARICSHFVRQQFLRRRPAREMINRPPAVGKQGQGP